MEVRPAGPGDLDALQGLIAAFRDHLRADGPTDAVLAEGLPRFLADPAIEFALARVDGRPAGYTQTLFVPSLWASGVEAVLEDVFVRGDFRRRGVGRALLRHAVARARERGAGFLGLTTNERNEAAQALYRAEGLRLQRERIWGDGREVRWVIVLRNA